MKSKDKATKKTGRERIEKANGAMAKDLTPRPELRLWQVFLPIVTMTVFILLAILVWKVPIHLALLLEITTTVVLAMCWKFSWTEIEKMMLEGFGGVGRMVMIMILIGVLIGTWISSGTVPSMIYYGLKVISPKFFILTSFVLASIVSMAIGTAIGTVSTIGLALVSIGLGLQMPLPLVAGAIISGAYFGDRMSPVSSIAIMTAHSAGAELYDVIKHMIYSVIPPYIIAAVLYLILGLKYSPAVEQAGQVQNLMGSLHQHFMISPLLLIPPILIILLAYKRVPTIPNVVISIGVSVILGLVVEKVQWTFLLQTMFYGYKSVTGNTIIDQLLSRGGLMSMMELNTLLILAGVLGGLFEGTGILRVILQRLMGSVKTGGQLILATMVSSVAAAMLGCNQMLAVFLPGKMLQAKYDEIGLSRKDLGRALADSGLILSPMIPWNINGLMMTGVLGVSTMKYFAYAFLPLMLPVVAIIYGFTGFTIERTKSKSLEEKM